MTASLPSRGFRGYAGAILAGAISVVCFTIAREHLGTPLLMLSYLGAIPLFIVGLGAGVISGALAGIAAVIALAVARPLDFTLIYGIAYALPATVLTVLALRHGNEGNGKSGWYAEGNLLTAIALYPCMAFLAAVAAAWNHAGGLLGETQAWLNTYTAPFKDQLDAANLAQLPRALDEVARMAPATLGSCWMLIMMLSFVIAQIALKQQGWNLRPTLELKQIALPRWLIVAPVAAGLAACFAPAPYNYIGLNLSVLLSLTFFIVGLAIVHSWAATMKAGIWILVVFYVLLAIPVPITMIPVSLLTLFLGVSDQWIDFRRRFAGKKKLGVRG